MKTVRDLGLTVGQDMSIIGLDDYEITTYLELTTIRQPIEQSGEIATRSIKEQLDAGPQADHQLQRVEFAPELMLRSTTGPVPNRL